MEDRRHTGTWIPACLEYDQNLSVVEEKLLAIINSLDHPENGCVATNAYLAPFLKVTKGRVSKMVSKLSELGYISVVLIRDENKAIKKRVIRVTHTALILARGGMVENDHRGMVENNHTLWAKTTIPMVENDQGIIKNIEKKIEKREEAPAGEISFSDFVSQWKAKPSYRMEVAWARLTDAEKAEISKHLPRYLKANPGYVGKPETYLEKRKWTEEIYTPPAKQNGQQQVGPPSPTKRNFV